MFQKSIYIICNINSYYLKLICNEDEAEMQGMNGGVVQGIERWITNPAVASSILAPATIL